ncbi:MAG: hypothetical protein CMP10_21395 [Zetaproteobacteria bacterium]|nr:hypothetical protein [Pseudobdellovibrionaceae bacterium]
MTAEQSSDPKVKRRLRNILLQPLVQVKLGMYSICLAFLFSIVIMTLLYMNFYRFYDMVLELTDLREEVSMLLQGYIMDATGWLLTTVIVYLIMNIAISVYYTHRLVGPTYAFRRHIDLLRNGEFDSRVQLRKGDAFEEVANDLNDLASQLDTNNGQIQKKSG